MAIIQTKAGTWRVYWKNPITGKQESKTYRTKREAKKQNSLILYRLSTEPESFRPEEPKSVITLKQVYDEYLKEKNFPTIMYRSHRWKVKLLIKYLGDKDTSTLTDKDLEKFCKYVIDTANVSESSINTILTASKTVIRYAQSKGYASKSLVFPRIKGAIYQKFIPPSYEELQKLYNVAVPHIKRVLILGAYFGARVGPCEMFSLTWEDVDFNKKVLRIHGAKKNKHEQYREVPIKDSLLSLFIQWKEEDKDKEKYLIHFKGKSVHCIKFAWKDTLKKAGITRRIRPYDLRHMFGTELVAQGVDVGTVAELMGHANPTMLLTHYQYVLKVQKRNAIEALQDMLL